MTRVIYVNGRYLPWGEASVHAEDRGFQFADAVYEVCEVQGGAIVDEGRHLARLDRSLKELACPAPMSLAALGRVMRECIRRNRVDTGLVYLQVSRGVAPRDYLFPRAGTRPTLVVVARPQPAGRYDAAATTGISVISAPDTRWERCDIKTVMLLPASMAKEAAKKAGAKEAWLVDGQGRVTEGASSNAWIVDAAGRLITRQADTEILRGVTRTTLIVLLQREGIELVERPFTIGEAQAAREAFITSASNTVMPVVRIDGKAVGSGKPGELTAKLRRLFHSAAEISR